MNPEPIINVLFALRDRLGKRATLAQAIGVLELIQSKDGLTGSELVALAQSGSPSTHFANSLVKAGFAKKTTRVWHSREIKCLVATPRALELL
jgi:hypothetical protein